MIEQYTYLNNYSEIMSYINDDKIIKIIKKLNVNENIKVTSNLIHTEKEIDLYEQFIFNLDNYITYIKSLIYINPLEIKILINNTLYNPNIKILYSKLYYYSNIEYYQKNFKKMFLYQYKKNIRFLHKKNISIKNRSFNELIKHINLQKKRTYIYFEKITNNNMYFYLPIIEYLELNS